MKIDLKQLSKLEKQFRNNDQHVSLNTVQSMIELILGFNETSFKLAPDNIKMAITTLKELGIYKDESEVKQLNS